MDTEILLCKWEEEMYCRNEMNKGDELKKKKKGKEEKIGAVEGCCVFCLECKSHMHADTHRHIHARVRTVGRKCKCLEKHWSLVSWMVK